MSHSERANAADGTEIAWSATGEGPDVVLVHGITENAGSWQPIVDRLSADHRVVSLDLRGHGESGTAERYDLEAMAGDVAAVMAAAGASASHLVGHSLGGIVVSAAGAAMPVASVVNVDQSLQLGGFKAALAPAEALLRDPASFPAVISQLFVDMRGELGDAEFARINGLRRPDQNVVLGVWELIFTMSEAEIAGVVDQALAGYGDVAYLSLFGIDPGPDYAAWLKGHIVNSQVELWDGAGHYPHLHQPDRFVDRLRSFWATAG
jgi:pimeloyl-ACP methyl ester carboxylesterase